jgi:thiol-disulfide isomerase/thioredoxin
MKIFITVILIFYSQLIFAQQREFSLQEFTLTDTTGKNFNLKKIVNKRVLVDCWFPACKPCMEEIPYTKALQQRLKTLGLDSFFTFITICFKQSEAEWKLGLKKFDGIDALHLYAEGGKYEANLSYGNYPTFRLFSNTGILDKQPLPYAHELGAIDFVLFAAIKNMGVYTAEQLYKNEVKQFLNKNDKTVNSNNTVVQDFLKLYLPHYENFKQQLQQIH